ncbi:putative sulfate permease [Tilletiaria anomala UBC 951]|uniref:Putative sulfate permease n=1 Tax=Tilletiaria anomala (strain ATCC 24038 / CBS 436.72 / UBC 951) TaxID=1037660 RepID=A0A066VH56_TILAU|nr:putative sulfate permease [Tilletiaria anomala UBC 951]KDN38099.1 putative sulfate permease [Tilletiaria anomala UBC 951]
MSHRTGGRGRASGKVSNAWKWVIGYNDTEANRLGVPIVSSADWFSDIFSNPGRKTADYLDSLFPIRRWIGSYNLQWAIGDLIAGITVALVLVPQSMSYAKLAGLSPEFGLYSSFVGVMVYALFATSKDVTIGPVAVMSLQTNNVILAVMAKTGKQWTPDMIASALAFLCGVITFGIGILRLGWLVEFIPTPAVSGFMTGSAITIAVGQFPKIMGITSVQTNSSPAYKIFLDTLKALPQTTLDAAFGLPALFFLYAVRSFFTWLPGRHPRLARVAFFTMVLRSAFVIIVLTIASRVWLGGYSPKQYPISILKTVPRGFQHIGRPNLDPRLLADMGSELPVSVIVLLLEHIAISKSFGRLNNYKINPNQELIAIGVTNLVGPTFGAYPATGSFSRTAIKAKSGVRTPIAGWVTGVVVLIALYALTGTFYWIPSSALSAVIIHAVGDLIASPRALYKFWLVNPFELFIWFASVLVTVFANVEYGVYTSVAASAALLLIRIARPRGRWLGMVRVSHGDSTGTTSRTSQVGGGDQARIAFVPLDDKDGLRDPSIQVKPPPPGVLIYQPHDSFLYPNASHLADLIIDRVKAVTKPGQSSNYAKPGDRPWNDPGPVNPVFRKVFGRLSGKSKEKIQARIAAENDSRDDPRPRLRAIVFDFASVANVDTTSIQTLVDVRRAVEIYVDGPVEFHFANILSPWIRRALLAGDFGVGTASRHITEVAPVVYQRDNTPITYENNNNTESNRQRQRDDDERRRAAVERVLQVRDAAAVVTVAAQAAGEPSTGSTSPGNNDFDIEKGTSSGADSKEGSLFGDRAGVQGTSGGALDDISVHVPIIWGNDLTPLFHLDLASAVEAAAGKY